MVPRRVPILIISPVAASWTSTDGRNWERTPAIFETIPRESKVLWIAAAGGHIAEAVMIDEIIGSTSDSVWVTFDTPQTRSILDGRRVEFVDYVAPRDLIGSAKAAARVSRIARAEAFDLCLSTGSAVAGLSVPLARALGTPSVYVESLARVSAPSLTGRLLRRTPGVRTVTQYQGWGDPGWSYEGSIIDGWRAVETDVTAVRRILVTLGTIRPYRFDRAVDTVLRSLRPGDEVVWQLGSTTRDDLPGDVRSELSHDELEMEVRRADVIVAHAGVGSTIQAMAQHKLPVIAVRSAAHNEHVDDHQGQFAHEVLSRDLAVALGFGVDNRSRFEYAARRRLAPARQPQEV